MDGGKERDDPKQDQGVAGCVCVCMCVCMYVCMRVFVCVCVRFWRRVLFERRGCENPSFINLINAFGAPVILGTLEQGVQ